MVYFTTHWLPTHAGTTTKTGHRLPAPGSLSGVKSSLSTELEPTRAHRRVEPSDYARQPHAKQSAKEDDQRVQRTKGYEAEATSKGYEQRAAEPIYSGKIQAMLQFLWAKQNSLTGKDKLLLIRDGLLISMLWQSCFRGFNVGELRLENLKTPTNSPAVPFIVPELKLQPNSQLHIHPDLTKNRKGGYFTVTISGDIMCFTTWLQLAINAYEEAQQPITNHIVRPLQKGTQLFAEKGMSSSAIWGRFTAHLNTCTMVRACIAPGVEK